MTENEKIVKGTSLWKDAWQRLLKNKLAVFGMIVLAIMVIAVIIGPAIIRMTTGFTADYIPSSVDNGALVKSFPPSAQHPMGTDDKGRDLLARVLQGGRISLMVGIISTIVSLFVGVSYGAIAGYLGGKIDNLMMRIVDIIYAIPYILIVIVLLSVFGGPNTPGWITAMSDVFRRRSGIEPDFPFVFRARSGFVADDGACRARAGFVSEKSGIRSGGAGDGRFDSGNYFPPSRPERARSGYRLRDLDRAERDADRSLSVISRNRRAGTLCFVGKSGGGRHQKYFDLPVAIDFPGRDDGFDFVFIKLFRRRFT